MRGVRKGKRKGINKHLKLSTYCHPKNILKRQIIRVFPQPISQYRVPPSTFDSVSRSEAYTTCYGYVQPLGLRLGRVTSLYMPQRASQRKFGKGLKLHLAKQKKQKLEETSWLKHRLHKTNLEQGTDETSCNLRHCHVCWST